jgi:hypothetical protein
VGAFEQQKVLTVYDRDMTEKLALEVCKEYTVAQAQRLEPHVQVQTNVVQTSVGYAAIICVEPSMEQAIGVRLAGRLFIPWPMSSRATTGQRVRSTSIRPSRCR